MPILIGEPVAATPGFEPQEETSTPDELELLAAAVELPAADDVPLEAALLLLLLLLLPHPASAINATAASSTRPSRMRGTP